MIILFAWFSCLLTGLLLAEQFPVLVQAGILLLQTFLYTGVFITAHDSMHGIVSPEYPVVNQWIGTISVFGYALFSFQKLKEEHQFHHQFPASSQDPDFHDGKHSGFWRWYVRFLLHYVTVWQITGMAIIFNLLLHIFKIPIQNLLFFWVLPSILSTIQLFYFGTFLPHRNESQSQSPHYAGDSGFPVWLSFLTCYHFGYHFTHHSKPWVPWWKLPSERILP